VSVIDTATGSVLASLVMPAGSLFEGEALSPDGSRLYAANRGANTVVVIDTATNTIAATIPCPGGLTALM